MGNAGELDWDLDVNTVSRLLDDQFPALSGRQIVRMGAGWDHELYLVDEHWVLRFPKRAKRVRWLVREIELMEVVAGALGGMVPRFELLGRPGAGCPYPFIGYQRLIGVAADQAGGIKPALAADVGHALSRLHRVPLDRIPPVPDNDQDSSTHHLSSELHDSSRLLRRLLDTELLPRAQPFLTGAEDPPADCQLQRVIHHDICPDHLIVNPSDGRLVGIIDFSDARVGDPVLDFVGLIGLGGFPFISEVLESYELELGENFRDRLVWLTRASTLSWLAEAATYDRGGIAKHLRWVTAALADPPSRLG